MNQDYELQNIPVKTQEPPPPYTEGPPPPNTTSMPAGRLPGYRDNVLQGVIPIVVGQQMGPKSSAITCPSCSQEIVTRVEFRPTVRTHLFAALLCILGCFLCSCIPYCISSCQNANHYCPNCNAFIGTYVN